MGLRQPRRLPLAAVIDLRAGNKPKIIREFVAQLASEAGVADPDGFARQWHILMKGSIVAAGEGDRLAARRAKEIAALLLHSEASADPDAA